VQVVAPLAPLSLPIVDVLKASAGIVVTLSFPDVGGARETSTITVLDVLEYVGPY
jgi:hypothetical protein